MPWSVDRERRETDVGHLVNCGLRLGSPTEKSKERLQTAEFTADWGLRTDIGKGVPTMKASLPTTTTASPSRMTIDVAPLLVSVRQAAEILSLPPASVYDLLGNASIESVRVERRRLVVYRSLVEFVDGLPRTVAS